jgi:L-lactate dehydrogenase complex protein LldF
VKIDIPTVLLHLRAKAVQAGAPRSERATMRAVGFVFGSVRRLRTAQRAARILQRPFVHNGLLRRLPPPLNRWTATRDLEPVARQSFRDWWQER